MKKLLVFLVLTGGALYGAYYWFQQRGKGSKDVAYSTVPVEHGRLIETISATGVVQPRQVYVVGTELAGKVTEVLADFNQEVEEGAVLLRLDDRAAKQKLAEAQAVVDSAEAAVRQAEALRDSAVSLLQREKNRDPLVRRDIEIKILENQVRSGHLAIESAQFKVKQARQAVAQAELGVRLTVVRAPVLRPVESGSAAETRPGVGGVSDDEPKNGERRKFLVLDRRVALNQMIGPPLSGHLFTLAGDLSVMQVEAQVAEGDFPRVSRGLPVEFTVPGAGDEEPLFHGKVEDMRLMPVNDRGAIFYKVIIEARNDRDPTTGRWKLTPGQTATVEVLRRTHERVWKMPATALNFQPETQLTLAARDRLEKWDGRKDREDWKTVWVVGGDSKPWPLFVRTGGVGAKGETGIRDLSFSEVLEWDPDLAPKPDPANPATWPEVIIAAQAVKGGLFSQPNIKF